MLGGPDKASHQDTGLFSGCVTRAPLGSPPPRHMVQDSFPRLVMFDVSCHKKFTLGVGGQFPPFSSLKSGFGGKNVCCLPEECFPEECGSCPSLAFSQNILGHG